MRTPVRLLALAVLASALTLVPPPALATADEPSPRPAPLLTRYDGTFVGELTLVHQADLGGPNHRTITAYGKITSRLPGVRFSNGSLVTSGSTGSLSVKGTSTATTVSDDGMHTEWCASPTITPTTTVPPFLATVAGQLTFYAFTSLVANGSCTSTSVQTPYPMRLLLPAVPVPVTIRPSQIGAARITVPINRTMPKDKCPGNILGTDTCDYRLEGTLTLRLVPDIDAFQPPTKAALKRNAAKASIKARCASACTATLEVRPLRGPGRATTKATLRPGAGKTLSIKPNPQLRKAIDRSGGARFKVTYRIGSLSRTYTSAVRS